MRKQNVVRRWGLALVVGIAAAAAAGVVSGAFARALMRAATMLAGGEAHFSWTGTVGVVTVYSLALLPGAVAAAGGLRRTSRLLLALGATLLVVEGVVIAAQEDIGTLFAAGFWRSAGSALVLLGFPVGVTAQVAGVVQLSGVLLRGGSRAPTPLREPASV